MLTITTKIFHINYIEQKQNGSENYGEPTDKEFEQALLTYTRYLIDLTKLKSTSPAYANLLKRSPLTPIFS